MIGRKIVNVEMLNDEDMETEGWDDNSEVSAVLVLDDGARIYASQDYEGNNSGALFGSKDGKCFTVFCQEDE